MESTDLMELMMDLMMELLVFLVGARIRIHNLHVSVFLEIVDQS